MEASNRPRREACARNSFLGVLVRHGGDGWAVLFHETGRKVVGAGDSVRSTGTKTVIA